MADTNIKEQVPESNVDSLYTEIDNTLSPIQEVPSTITETSIHNKTSINLGSDRENDEYLKINKEEKVSLQGLENKKTTYAPTANLDVTHFADKRFISKQLSDKNDTVIMADLDKEIARSYETDVVLASALNLEDEEREIADAQLRADIAKEALERANTDADLANALEKYKYAMSQHITTRELDVNGDTHISIEIQDGDKHGGNLNVNTTLVVGSNIDGDNGTSTSEGKVIGDAYIKHDLFVDNNADIGNDAIINNNAHIKNDLLVDKNTEIKGNLSVDGKSLLNELEIENDLTVNGNLRVKGDSILDKTLTVENATTLKDTLQVNKKTTIGTIQNNADLELNGSGNITKNLKVVGTSNLGETIIGSGSSNKNLTVNGNETIIGNLNVNTNTDLDGSLNVDGETTLNANVKINDDSNTQKSFSDIIGTIKNALVKDFTQSYDPTTGQLTSTLEFNNLYNDNTNRPIVDTITKTINLDLEKYILDINDVYATKTVSNGKTTYTDFDISTLTDEQIRELESPDYTGDVVRCLKVKYNTYNNTNAGTEKAYVYFEINDIFRSIISKVELEINNEINARNNAITDAINNLDVDSVGENGKYIKTISETNGKISASTQSFDTTINGNSTNNNAPTSKAVYDLIGTLDVDSVGSSGGYIKTISETNGKISASRQAFDTSISSSSDNNNAPTSKAVYDYLKNHEKTITIKDAAGNILFSFVCYAPDANDYSSTLGPITLKTTTII